MFARSVTFQLKPNRVAEFTKALESDIIPRLRKQKGFQDEITFVGADGTEAVGISLWDLKENADAYAGGGYPGVLKAMEHVIQGTPQVRTYDVTNSTFHKIATPVTA
jgi:hypothetical protein